ncbi:hypothetical protein DES39_0537 [Orbus hercynius]|uniref:Uncharacterized protein n=1 Tax=Orbus hercynius TaxID=593135 RepID=A0A495RIH6_9GAMM|nr:hypothetical protein [Orbus hercynius]RKS87317.1 hypothetical protein DES39_0537 [Orbus hercynius]
MLLIERVEDYFDDYERLVSGFYFSEINVSDNEYYLDFIKQDSKNKLENYSPLSSSSTFNITESLINIFHARRYEFRFNNRMVPYFADQKIDFDDYWNSEFTQALLKCIKLYLNGENVSGCHEYQVNTEYKDKKRVSARVIKITVIK